MQQRDSGPHIVVFSSLFPSERQPGLGLFVRERMFRVGGRLPLAVVSPVPWFPFQGLLRRLRPGFRPGAPAFESQQGFDVWHPRFLSVPGVLKRLDGAFMALGALPRLSKLKREGRLDIIDAHFAYPEGYAAGLLGRWLGVPVTITLRGTETRHARDPVLRRRIRRGLQQAKKVFSVSESLRRIALSLGISPDNVRVVGNGVDVEKFVPIEKGEARRTLGLASKAPVLVTVGGLVERKGFHRVIECLPALRAAFPGLQYLIVGGASPEGDWTERLKALVNSLRLQDCVRFLGALPAEDLKLPLSAADVFVLSSRNEGWANVLLEAMACGLPVVTTDVGGNAEVVCDPRLGTIVPFDDAAALLLAVDGALRRRWDRASIRHHALRNTWDQRVDALVQEFQQIAGTGGARSFRPAACDAPFRGAD
ncbi:MAG TPA: glycosyltransferase [Rhodocyclaceae bacterium]|nr:glycosyltransferase [Rhodocyclaceae bacterium]HUY02638.1 glycosyltransferase [Rhodocyclaceae bacterium]